MDAQTIADTLVNSVTGWGLCMDDLVGQGYDGASVMSSCKNGVQAKIQQQFPNATYVHCRSHVLALVIAKGCKQVPEIQNLFDNVEKLTWFLGGSAKRKALFKSSSDSHELGDFLIEQADHDEEFDMSNTALKRGVNKKCVPKFCSTRWTARIDTLSALLSKYKTVLETLEKIQEASIGDSKRDAGSYARLLTDPQFLVSLVVAQFILSYFASVTKSLQAVNCDLGSAYRDIHLSKETVAKARCESTWDKLYERIESIGSEIDVTIVKPRTTKIQRHRSNAGADVSQGAKDYFRVNAFYPFIDHLLQDLDSRFSDQHSNLVAAEALIPVNLEHLTPTCMAKINEYYSKFLKRGEYLQVEVEKWKHLFQHTPVESRPADGCTTLAACNKVYFPAIHRILVIFLTTPVGSVACER
ncbi:zinc finger MYM-type protein 1-like [Gigantopelta aegis]|uniref:zinc finger MYM-type protein 1-like n=1 Tax=Gigantopelta aegis TaxID=1735272 RepID=UPI001B88985C|nr:zinc finger MYM-type protein 1-like [Gigantopelta aegis]